MESLAVELTTAAAQKDSVVFPESFRLTPFEELLLHRDSSDCPCSCTLRLSFSGVLDAAILDRALLRTLERHPLLTSRIGDVDCRPVWKVAPNPARSFHWMNGAAAETFKTSGFIDVRRNGGLKLIGERCGDRTILYVHFHHSCCDGMGIMCFLTDLLNTASQLTNDTYEKDRSGNDRSGNVNRDDNTESAQNGALTKAVATRGSWGLSYRDAIKLLPAHLRALHRPWRYLTRPATPLLTADLVLDRLKTSGETEYPGTCLPRIQNRRFSRSDLARYRASAKRQGVSINDLLMRDVFLTIRELRQLYQISDTTRWTRLLIPINYRLDWIPNETAANYTTMMFIDRRLADPASPYELLLGLSAEMQKIRRQRLGHGFLMALSIFRRLPGGLRRFAGGRRCDVTAVMTNVGKILTDLPGIDEAGHWRLGEAKLEHVDVVAPLTPMTDASISAVSFAGELSVTLNFNSVSITAEQTDDFLRLLSARILLKQADTL